MKSWVMIFTAIIEVTAVKGKTNEVEEHISIFPNVCAVYYITGLTDMTIIAKFRNRKDLSDFIKRIWHCHILKEPIVM